MARPIPNAIPPTATSDATTSRPLSAAPPRAPREGRATGVTGTGAGGGAIGSNGDDADGEGEAVGSSNTAGSYS